MERAVYLMKRNYLRKAIVDLVSQAKDVNFKQYRDIERAWEKALKKIPPDEITDLKIEIIYDGNSVRPKEFRIKYCINGKPYEPDAIPNV